MLPEPTQAEKPRSSRFEAASFAPQLCVGGYHLFNPLTKKTVDRSLMDETTENLKKYPLIQFNTCHCIGKKTYEYLASNLPNMLLVLRQYDLMKTFKIMEEYIDEHKHI